MHSSVLTGPRLSSGRSIAAVAAMQVETQGTLFRWHVFRGIIFTVFCYRTSKRRAEHTKKDINPPVKTAPYDFHASLASQAIISILI